MDLAVIKTGGKQYKVEPGKKIKIEKTDVKKGGKIDFSDVLLVADDKEVNVGNPLVKGASVIGKFLKNVRGEKKITFKYGSKTRRRVKRGHRQDYMEVEIESIK